MNCNVEKIAGFIKSYDSQLYNHCLRTAIRSEKLGRLMNCDTELIYQAALIHDLGKIGISRSIFDKPSKLTAIERRAIDMHSFIGYSLAINLVVPKNICILILYHHGYYKERFGECSFVPDNLKECINIIRISDIYDALTSERAYCKQLSHNVAIKILYENSDLDKDMIRKLDTLYKMNVSDKVV